jgi:hypothetical protein
MEFRQFSRETANKQPFKKPLNIHRNTNMQVSNKSIIILGGFLISTDLLNSLMKINETA